MGLVAIKKLQQMKTTKKLQKKKKKKNNKKKKKKNTRQTYVCTSDPSSMTLVLNDSF